MLRIVLTSTYCWPEVRRGGERYLHEVAAAMKGRGHEVRILSSASAPGRDKVLGVPTVRVRGREWRPGSNREAAREIAFGWQARTRLSTARIDVWHALTAPDGAAAADVSRLRSGVRSVYTELGYPARRSRERRPDGPAYKRLVERVDTFICLSRATGAVLERDYGRSATVLGGGVDLSRFQPASARSASPVIAFVSDAATPRKNLGLLLDAVPRLRTRFPELEVWILGPGSPDRALEAAGPAATEVVTVAHEADEAELMQRYGRAWVTVLPSRSEAFGLVVLESLACGTPVVVLEDEPPAELVEPGTGAVASEDPRSVADACAEALELAGRGDTVDRCRAAAGRHDWSAAIAPRLEEIYGGMHS